MSGKTSDIAGGDGAVDLFGAPVSQIRERWGRPSFKKDKENQQHVAVLKARGWSTERIAKYIGCSEPTLRKNFFRELQAGADMIEAEMLAVLYAKARGGNVSAVERLMDRLELNPAFAAKNSPKAAAPAGGDTPEKLGKKAMLEKAAKNPTGSWGDLLN